MPADGVRLTHHLTAVLTAIWFEIDHGDGSGVSAHFTPDATLTVLAHTVCGRPQIDELYASRAARGPRVSRHLVTNVHLSAATDTMAETVSSLCLFAEDGDAPRPITTPAMVADVVDRFEHRAGRWFISSRHIRAVFMASGTVLGVATQ